MHFAAHIHPSVALLSLLMAAGSVALALRESSRSGVAFAIGYVAFALCIGLAHWSDGAYESVWLAVLENLTALIGFVAFWSGCWLRSGQPVPVVFLTGIASVWLLSLVPWLLLVDEPALRLSVDAGCVAAGSLSAGWAIWARKGDRNVADVVVVAALILVLIGLLALVVVPGMFGTEAHVLEQLVALAAPVFLIAIGLFSNLSFAFDAMTELDRRSEIDPLTGLLNRRAFERRVAPALEAARRYNRPLSVVMADLDHFKRINDTFGHAAGDVVLKEFAGLIRRGSRSIDFAARLGGEEFVVVMPESNVGQARGFAERIRQTAERRIQVGGRPVTASFGIVEAHGKSADINRLFDKADQALYRAKELGRNRVIVSGEENDNSGSKRNDE